jgi:Flp pilus assembly pilin Flp
MFGISKLLHDKRGVGAIEYALVAGMISLAAYSGYCDLGSKLKQHYDKVDTAITAAL